MIPEITTSDGAIRETRVAALAGLAQQVRDLLDAVVLTDVPEDELTAATTELAGLTERLMAAHRDAPPSLEIGPDGRYRHLGNAVTGECNPQALPLIIERTAEGVSRARVTFRPVHVGPPACVHGGMSAMILDHLLGDAVAAAGKAGVTGTLTIKFRGAVPYGEELAAHAVVSRSEGRKTWADGVIACADGTALVEATGLFITPAQWVQHGPGLGHR